MTRTCWLQRVSCLIIKFLLHWMFAQFRDIYNSAKSSCWYWRKTRRHVQIMGETWKIICHSTVWKRLGFFPQHGRQITQWNSMLKRYSLLFVSFYFVGIEMICASRRHSVCKALSYLCHNIKKLSGMEWFAYRSMFCQLWGCLTSQILKQLILVTTLQVYSYCNKCFNYVYA